MDYNYNIDANFKLTAFHPDYFNSKEIILFEISLGWFICQIEYWCIFAALYFIHMKKLKQRWGLTSNLQVFLVLVVFAINGSFAAYITKPATDFVGLDAESTSPWIFWPARILLVFVIYQLTLPIVGFVFGQYRFFINFSKKMLSRMGFGVIFRMLSQ